MLKVDTAFRQGVGNVLRSRYPHKHVKVACLERIANALHCLPHVIVLAFVRFGEGVEETFAVDEHRGANKLRLCAVEQRAKCLTEVVISVISICCCKYLRSVRRVTHTPLLVGFPVADVELHGRLSLLPIQDTCDEPVLSIAATGRHVERRIHSTWNLLRIIFSNQ